jgi:hypothetical protein
MRSCLEKIWFQRKPFAESNISRVREKRLPFDVEVYVITEAESMNSEETKVSYAKVSNLVFVPVTDTRRVIYGSERRSTENSGV